MVLHRRTVLQVAGTAGLASLAGCSAVAELLSPDEFEYTLTVDPVDRSLVDHALYEPTDEEPFSAAAREALDDVLPDGRHTTSGFEPLPARAYVEHEGRYFQTQTVVTGRERMERTLVRARRIDDGAVPDDATAVDSLPDASGRVVEILHDYHSLGGTGSAGDSLHGDAYVLRRPAELDGPIAGDLDGEVVTIDDDRRWAYRLSLATERITEPVYETFAVDVADDERAFHEVVLATRVDAEVDPLELALDVRHLLEETIDTGSYQETTPLSEPFDRLVDRLGLADVDVNENGLLLWYDESLFRYGLYVSPAN